MDLVRFIAGLFSRCANWPFRSIDEGPAAHVLGRRGEAWAARHLRRHGYKVLYRNFRSGRGGEVDLVCRDRRAGELVFVEVKTRHRTDYGQPGEAVNVAKQRLVARGALAWLRLLDQPQIIYRFDIVEVVVDAAGKPQCNIIQNAFTLPEPWRD